MLGLFKFTCFITFQDRLRGGTRHGLDNLIVLDRTPALRCIQCPNPRESHDHPI